MGQQEKGVRKCSFFYLTSVGEKFMLWAMKGTYYKISCFENLNLSRNALVKNVGDHNSKLLRLQRLDLTN